MARQLRPYQLEAVEAVYQQWVDGKRTVVVLPTGTGKSTVIARIATDAVDHGQRVLMVAHRRELLDQMVANVHAVDPIKVDSTGYVQAERDEYDAPIVAGSFQTLTNPRRLSSLGRRDVVLVDEVHHSPADTYAGVLEALVADHGTRFLAGFTATLKRTDGGLGDMWDTVAYERSLSWALEEGYLVPPVGKTVVLPGRHVRRHPRGVGGRPRYSFLSRVYRHLETYRRWPWRHVGHGGIRAVVVVGARGGVLGTAGR